VTVPLVIHWFQRDLRLQDNPALTHAAHLGTVIPVYIHDTRHSPPDEPGGAASWWLHHSLSSLNESLKGRLTILKGDPLHILPRLVANTAASHITWTRCYEPWQVKRNTLLKQKLASSGIQVQSRNGSLLWEPWEVLKKDTSPYRVFTPYHKKASKELPPPRHTLPKPEGIMLAPRNSESLSLEKLGLLHPSGWHTTLETHWTPGEQGAQERLATFIKDGLGCYSDGRDYPGRRCISRLSPSLHFGELSPNQAWHAAALSNAETRHIEAFQRELGWREFAWHLLWYNPHMPSSSLRKAFERFPWQHDNELLQRWKTGRTGYPLVDAGMRELWQTGFMHNRVRMITASFLTKNLLQDWRTGAAWFRDCLLDANMAANSASWQWVAGSGTDAAPYFRIFNPVTQAAKFDPDGTYTRKFIPELARLPLRHLHTPWLAPADVLHDAGITLGSTYPEPVIDLTYSRSRALEAYDTISSK